MKLNLTKPDEANKAEVYFAKLLKDGAKIELKRISPPRSINQNSYLHVLFTLWGNHFGYTVEESKQVVKFTLEYYYKKGDMRFYDQTSTMTSKELSEFVDKFRNWSASEGLFLPSADDYKLRFYDYSKEVERAEYNQRKYSY